jgi:hypothetical protein
MPLYGYYSWGTTLVSSLVMLVYMNSKWLFFDEDREPCVSIINGSSGEQDWR